MKAPHNPRKTLVRKPNTRLYEKHNQHDGRLRFEQINGYIEH